jgi:hypothetical protein
VRRTSTEYAFVADPGGTSWSDPVTDLWKTGTVAEFDTTGGWLGYSDSANGGSPALGFVFGKDLETLLPDQISKSWLRWGYAGGTPTGNETDWRNYFVTTAIRQYNLSQGKGLWSRYYFVLGDDVQDLSDQVADRGLVNAELRAFDYTEASTPLVAYGVTGSGADFRVVEDSRTPQFFLYAHPVGGSFPVFEVIEDDNSCYLTWNPYASGLVKPYDGTIAGLRLLGFAMPSAGATGSYAAIDGLLPVQNYLADGKTLYVRTATEVETWRVKHFGLMDNVGDASNTADPDRDAVNNLIEYGLGGDPTDGSDVGNMPVYEYRAVGGTNVFEYVYARRRDAAVRGLSYAVEATTDLLPPTWSTNGVTETGAVPTDVDFESVTTRMPASESGFFRLRIELEE